MPTKTKKRTTPRAPSAKRKSMTLSIKELMEKYIYRIDLDADYQREKVWSKKEQEQLLDSIIKDIDIPKLYLAKVSDNKQFDFECIDGKQRLLTLSSFFSPSDDTSALLVDVLSKKYTYEELEAQHPTIANAIDEYTLDFVVYDESKLTEGFIRDIFRRLQLGIRLNSGELLNSLLGSMREFVFKDVGREGPFFRHTKLSDKRYSRQFTLAQICINSFHRHRSGEFVRARLIDLQDFFDEESSLNMKDENFSRIREVLELMDKEFGDTAQYISSRAIAVSAYLFAEELYTSKQKKLVRDFAKFYIELLKTIEHNMELISQYEKPENARVMDEFQKYVLQASVEPYSIKRRNDFLHKAFDHYKATKGRIIR